MLIWYKKIIVYLIIKLYKFFVLFFFSVSVIKDITNKDGWWVDAISFKG
jgi:hypothetical protein